MSSLANLDDAEWGQDWPLEVADSQRVDEFIELYRRATDADDRFALMALILDSLDGSAFAANRWAEVERLLGESPTELAALIIYWACVEETDEGSFVFDRPAAECFPITPLARRVLVDVRDRIGFSELLVTPDTFGSWPRLESFSIEGDLGRADSERVEVTVRLANGSERWCYFVTPRAIEALAEAVPHADERFVLGRSHMIVLPTVHAQTIRRVLEHLDATGRLIQHTLPVFGSILVE